MISFPPNLSIAVKPSKVAISAPASSPLHALVEAAFEHPVGAWNQHVAARTATRRVVDDDVAAFPDQAVDATVDVGVARRLVVRPARVQRGDASARLEGAMYRFRDLIRLGRQVRIDSFDAMPPVGATVTITFLVAIIFSPFVELRSLHQRAAALRERAKRLLGRNGVDELEEIPRTVALGRRLGLHQVYGMQRPPVGPDGAFAE